MEPRFSRATQTVELLPSHMPTVTSLSIIKIIFNDLPAVSSIRTSFNFIKDKELKQFQNYYSVIRVVFFLSTVPIFWAVLLFAARDFSTCCQYPLVKWPSVQQIPPPPPFFKCDRDRSSQHEYSQECILSSECRRYFLKLLTHP